jgi:hypothetical protein
VPDAQTTHEDTPLVFSTAIGNAVSLYVETGDASLTLGVDHGTLALGSTYGLTFTVGTGTNDATMTFQGTISNVNSALSGLTGACRTLRRSVVCVNKWGGEFGSLNSRGG